MPQSTQKTTQCGILRLSRTVLEKHAGKILVRAKFAFLLKPPKGRKKFLREKI
jgi:hypothetical protein